MKHAARIAAGLVVAGSLAWVALFLFVALSRVAWPFELEWMGGAFVDHVCRVLDGLPVYVEPSADYVPFLYGPLYFYASAGMSLLTGEGFLPLRLVSILATLATFAVLFEWLRRRTASKVAAALAVGIYASGYVVVDTWYDTSRADSLFIALVAATLFTLDRGTRARADYVGAGLLLMAYLAKQTALLLAPPLCVALALHSPRRALRFGLAFAALWIVTNGLLDWLHDGWFLFYTWTLPRRHGYITEPLWTFWRHDLMPLWPALCAGVGFVVARLASRIAVRDTLAVGAVTAGLSLAALSSRMHVGGAINVVMPAILALAILGGLAWREACDVPRLPATLLRALCLLQLATPCIEVGTTDDPHPPRLFVPASVLPSDADTRVGERLMALLESAEGEVLVPMHGYLPRMAGKRGGAHAMALLDLQRSGEPELWARVEKEFYDSARDRRAAVVVLDDNLEGFAKLVVPGYAFAERLAPQEDESFMPPVGLRSRPVVVFRRMD